LHDNYFSSRKVELYRMLREKDRERVSWKKDKNSWCGCLNGVWFVFADMIRSWIVGVSEEESIYNSSWEQLRVLWKEKAKISCEEGRKVIEI